MKRAPSADAFIEEIRAEFPKFRLVMKRESLFSKAIDIALKAITLGAQSEYMTRYHTVIGNTLYLPDLWETTPDMAKVITLRHERVHLRQRRRYGDIVTSFLYLIPFFPLGLAYGRARIEWEAYTETIRATAEYHGILAASELREYIVSQFTSGAYGWMWPFRGVVERWFDEALAEVSAEIGAGPLMGLDSERG